MTIITSPQLTFFWSHREGAAHAECSQFYPCSMVIEALTFTCCEQWMHWRKAVVFGDAAIASAILAEPNPARQKALGRQVTNFSQAIWAAVARDVVFRGNIAKFSQHPDLLERLRMSCGTLLVEASPNDTVWGIGLTSADPQAADPATWRGTNWLGNIITEVRVALCGS
jgi:ribA/ribD-fused uncharacterized protein